MTGSDVDVTAQKKILRRNILKARRALSKEAILNESSLIYERLKGWDVFLAARTVFCYAATEDEAATEEIIRFLLKGKRRVAVPFVVDKKGIMECALIKSWSDLEKGEYGILAPQKENAVFIAPQEVELALVPGTAFAKDGRRLGMGGGFYDRIFAKMGQAVLAGLSLRCQLVDFIPCQAHDRRLSHIVTADDVYDCSYYEQNEEF